MIGMILAATLAETNPWVFFIGLLFTSSVIGTVVGIVAGRKREDAETNRSEAEAAELIQKASAALILQVQEQARQTVEFHRLQNEALLRELAELRAQVGSLEEKVSRIPQLEADILELTRGVHLLNQQLQEHNITPVYPPPPPSY